MIDTQPLEYSLIKQFFYVLVVILKDLFLLHVQRNKTVNSKEPPEIYLIVGFLPIAQLVHLVIRYFLKKLFIVIYLFDTIFDITFGFFILHQSRKLKLKLV